MSDEKAMEQRLRAYLKRSEIDTTETSIGWALAFAASEVQRALQAPARKSGTSRAIEQLRSVYPPSAEAVVLVLAELDRLYAQDAKERAEVQRDREKAERARQPELNLPDRAPGEPVGMAKRLLEREKENADLRATVASLQEELAAAKSTVGGLREFRRHAGNAHALLVAGDVGNAMIGLKRALKESEGLA